MQFACFFPVIVLVLQCLSVHCSPIDNALEGEPMTLETCMAELDRARKQVERNYGASLSRRTYEGQMEIAKLKSQIDLQTNYITDLELKVIDYQNKGKDRLY